MNIIQVGILGVAGMLLMVQLRQEKSEAAIYLCLGVSLFIFAAILGNLKGLIESVTEMTSYIKVEASYIGTLIKMLGITYMAEFSSGLCKDAGYQTLATQIEMFGKITILVLSMPILLALLKTIQEFLA